MEPLGRDFWTVDKDMRMLRVLRSNRGFSDVAANLGCTVQQAKTRASALGVREGFSKMMTGEEIQEVDARDRDARFIQHMAEAYQRGEFPK